MRGFCGKGDNLLDTHRWQKRLDAMRFVHALMSAEIEKICIENPQGAISTHIRKPDQYIEPYEHGHPESKKTGLWLKNLPLLIPTKTVEPVWIINRNGKRESPMHYYTKCQKARSLTYQGIANAMADQWGGTIFMPAPPVPGQKPEQKELFTA